MDKAKLVLVVGLILVLGAALTGCVDQTQNPDNGTDDSTTANTGGNNGGSNSGGGSDDGGNGDENVNPTVGEVDIDVENMTAECEVQQRVVSPKEAGEIDEVYSNAGPPFDERKAENMLHEELNDLRTTHGNDSIEPFVCDPYLREIAQEHSKAMGQISDFTKEPPGEGNTRHLTDELAEVVKDANITKNPEYANASFRYSGVCENPVEKYGIWFYQRNQNGTSYAEATGTNYGDMIQQQIDIAQNHEGLVRDMRGVWFKDKEDLQNPLAGNNDRGSMDILTNESLTRQGIGMHIDRDTRVVHVTQAVC